MMHIAIYVFVSVFAFIFLSIVLILYYSNSIVNSESVTNYHKSNNRRLKRHIVSVWISLAVLPWLPYALVESQTFLFLPQISGAVKQAITHQNIDFGKIKLLKILYFDNFNSRIYIVKPCSLFGRSPSGYEGVIADLKRDTTGWHFLGEKEGVWTDCGTADSNIFPPYKSKGDY